MTDTAAPEQEIVEDTVVSSVVDGVAWVRLNRPGRLNALTYPMMARLCATLDALADDREVRAVVLTGMGRAFCAGADTQGLADRRSMDADERRARIDEYARSSILLSTMAKPTIAAVNGAAVGAGLALALACDFVYAAEGSKFATGYAGIGTSGDYGISWFTTRRMGAARALRFLMRNDRLDARQAAEAGLVDEVIAPEELEASAGGLARELASGPTRAFARMKANVGLAAIADLPTVLRQESRLMVECLGTADHAEGIAAFAEKRAPRFTGA